MSRSLSWRRLLGAKRQAWVALLVLVLGFVLSLTGFLAPKTSPDGNDPNSEFIRIEGSFSSVPLANLPVHAQTIYKLIHVGGPFEFEKDGTVFANREKLLPAKPRGHYREYTVRTPSVRHRGARRLVCGGEPPTKPEVCFYTDDHYASFKRITP